VIFLITLNQIGSAIEDMVDEYAKEVMGDLDVVLDETAKKIIEYISLHAPRSGGNNALADSFVTESTGKGVYKTVSVYSGTKGRLTHLLEFGYTHRSGKFVGPRPFMRPAFDILSPKMIEDVKRIIEKGGK